MREELKEQIEDIVQETVGEEKTCPFCGYSRMARVDCEGERWRCLGCLALLQSVMIPLQEKAKERKRGRWNRNWVDSSDVQAYADYLKKQEKERKKEETI